MHLVARVRAGAVLPSNLPAELYPGPTKYHTVDRVAAKAGKVENKVGNIHYVTPLVCTEWLLKQERWRIRWETYIM